MYLGIDLGGTNLKAGIINEEGALVYQDSRPTDDSKGPENLISDIKNVIEKALKSVSGVKTIGVGAPGVVDGEGIVKIAPNLKGWKDIPLKMLLSGNYSQPVAIENDANAAALAELYLGAGKGERYFIYVTLGTGVGGAIIYNGSLIKGEFGGAGEIGHVIIDAHNEDTHIPEFRRGVMEELTGRVQIAKYAEAFSENFPKSILHRKSSYDPFFISEAINEGDKAAKLIFEKIGYYIGAGLVSVMNILDMRLLIFGGGVSLAHDTLLDSALDTIRRRAIPTIAQSAEIRKAKFRKDSGIIGAAIAGKIILEN